MLGAGRGNNKYSLLGGLRTSAQMLSYELRWHCSIERDSHRRGTLRLNELCKDQVVGWVWLFYLYAAVAFIIFFISALAEAGRSPFDLRKRKRTGRRLCD